MRALALALVLLAAPLAGCLGGADPPAGDDRDTDPLPPGDESGSDAARAPSLTPGLTWTYDVGGTQVHEDQVQIVVALAGSNGYLFTGAQENDLVEEIPQNRTWMGWQDYHLNPIGDDQAPLFQFPLEDQATWSFHDATATAQAATLQTPAGTLDGFEITTDEEDIDRSWTFARELGYLNSYKEERDGTLLLELQLTDVATTDQALWYRSHAQAEATGSTSAEVGISDEPDALVLSGGGDPGASVTILPPVTSQQAPWTVSVEDEPRDEYETREPAEGTWRVTTNNADGGQVHGSVTAVTWTPIEPRYGSDL